MTDPLFSVENKSVLVSGGSMGIGFAIASAFAERGAEVIITGRDAGNLEKAVSELQPAQGRVQGEICDVSRIEDIRKLAKKLSAETDRIYVLINVAGVNRHQRAETFNPEDYDFVMDINLKGAFFLSIEIGREMIRQGSGIQVNVDSLNSYAPIKGMAPYAMSKFGMVGMTRALAAEWGQHGIRVNSIAPGFILTGLTRKLWSDPDLQQWGTRNTPLKRLGNPDDLTGTALFLACEASSFMTGHHYSPSRTNSSRSAPQSSLLNASWYSLLW